MSLVKFHGLRKRTDAEVAAAAWLAGEPAAKAPAWEPPPLLPKARAVRDGVAPADMAQELDASLKWLAGRMSDEADRQIAEMARSAEAAANPPMEPPAASEPEAELERLADFFRAQEKRARQKIAERQRAERERVRQIEAEIARLKDEIAAEREGARQKIAAERRLIAMAQAALKAAEEGR